MEKLYKLIEEYAAPLDRWQIDLLKEELVILMLDFAKKFAQYWDADNGKTYREIDHDLNVFYHEYFKTSNKTNGEQGGNPS